MNLKNQPPILVPLRFREEIEGMSKAALMDLAWSFATRCSGQEEISEQIMDELCRERDAVLAFRKQQP